MTVIRDNELAGLMMIPLLQQYGITNCNVRGCTHKANTILTDVPNAPPIGICDEHYKSAEIAGEWKYTIDFK